MIKWNSQDDKAPLPRKLMKLVKNINWIRSKLSKTQQAILRLMNWSVAKNQYKFTFNVTSKIRLGFSQTWNLLFWWLWLQYYLLWPPCTTPSVNHPHHHTPLPASVSTPSHFWYVWQITTWCGLPFDAAYASSSEFWCNNHAMIMNSFLLYHKRRGRQNPSPVPHPPPPTFPRAFIEPPSPSIPLFYYWSPVSRFWSCHVRGGGGDKDGGW